MRENLHRCPQHILFCFCLIVFYHFLCVLFFPFCSAFLNFGRQLKEKSAGHSRKNVFKYVLISFVVFNDIPLCFGSFPYFSIFFQDCVFVFFKCVYCHTLLLCMFILNYWLWSLLFFPSSVVIPPIRLPIVIE